MSDSNYSVNDSLARALVKALAPQPLVCWCGKEKRTDKPFCNICYYSLPQRLRKLIFNGPGAYQAAVEWLQNRYPKKDAN